MPKFPHTGWIAAWTLSALVLALLLMGCLSRVRSQALPQTDASRAAPSTSTLFVTLTQTLVPPTLTSIPSPTGTMFPTSTPEPAGCQKPPEDYTRVEGGGWTINQRTLAMLMHAQEIYGGELEITGYAITQSSYNNSVAASFGTHSGGGAVDLSVLRRGIYTVLWDDIEPLIRALRAAGFAAWLREYGELHTDSPIYIHAIAVGDQELSVPARIS